MAAAVVGWGGVGRRDEGACFLQIGWMKAWTYVARSGTAAAAKAAAPAAQGTRLVGQAGHGRQGQEQGPYLWVWSGGGWHSSFQS